MNKGQAREILGIQGAYDGQLLKKRYRQLMHLVHPDNGETAGEYMYTAQEINEAYAFLRADVGVVERKVQKRQESVKKHWNAPINPNAYCEREVYEEVQDEEGSVIGRIVIGKDRYMWTLEEEFPLLLSSLFQASKSLLEEVDQELSRGKMQSFELYQAELTYLLAGQFVDSTQTLFELNLDIENGDTADIFYIPAMLELEAKVTPKGPYLLPMGVKNHRLYVKDVIGNPLGYISFPDDRMSFVVTPLFTQKNVQIKLMLSKTTRQVRKGKPYIQVDMWIKILSDQSFTGFDNTNQKIEELLRSYREDNGHEERV